MRCNETFGIIGGDKRQQFLYEEFVLNGFDVKSFAVEGVNSNLTLSEVISNSSSLILPIPFTKNKKQIFSTSMPGTINVSEILNNIWNTQIIFGGCLSDDFINNCQSKGVAVIDLLNDDTFELQNSIATAEGAICEAIINSTVNLHASNCLVLGYGKCATSISSRLLGLNANVTVCARRKAQQIKAYESGVKYINFYELINTIGDYDFIFNTIPSLVLTKNILANVKKEATIIDIASKPGGTDFTACNELNINSHLCLGLPGKYSPKTSAHIIYSTILQAT